MSTPLTDVELAYQFLRMDPPPAPNVEDPAELLQCWQSLTPDDRAILVRYARLLSAEDLPEAYGRPLRGAVSWEDALIVHRASLVRQRTSPRTKL